MLFFYIFVLRSAEEEENKNVEKVQSYFPGI